MPGYGEHLAPEAMPHLRKLGLIDLVSHACHRRSHGIVSAWGGGEPYVRDYVFDPHGCGVNLDRPRFDDALFGRLGACGGTVVPAIRLERIEATRSGWDVEVATETGRKTIGCRFLIDASGRAAAVSRRLGGRPRRLDRLVGLHVRLEAVACPSSMLLLEALPDGWWYSAPLAHDALVVAYMTDSDLLPSGPEARARFWRERLERSPHTRARVNGACASPAVAVVPAATQVLTAHAGRKWLAVGDASAAFDPLAATSLSKAFENAIKAARIVKDALGTDAWSPESYAQQAHASFRRYLHDRGACYRLEQRWPAAPFWQRRHHAIAPAWQEHG